MLRVALLALALGVATGCGHSKVTHFGELRATDRGMVKLDRSAPPPTANAPARNIADVQFLTARLGFLVSSNGQFDREPGGIQRTSDGGRTWHDVWNGNDARLHWIAFADRRHGFVAGDGFVLRTSDGGDTWHRSPMSVPPRSGVPSLLEPTFVTPTLGFAVTDPSSFAGPSFLWTGDGGSHWRDVRGPRSVVDIDFVSRQTGFALGKRLYRTDDGGASWRPIGTPRVPYPLAAVDFLDAGHGFLGGGYPAVTEMGPAQAVFATADGGRTWQRRFVNPRHGFSRGGGDPFARLHFADAQHGWATTGLCKCCPSGPCAGSTYVTSDGGYSWRRRGVEAQLSTVGTQDAWAVPDCDVECDLIWRTLDAGRTWRPIARPDRVDLASVAVHGSWVALTSYDKADFISSDGGQTWRFGTLALPPLRTRIGKRFYADETCGPTAPFTEVGRTLRITDDGGRSWNVVNAPFAPGAAAIAVDLLVVSGMQNCSAALAVSRDGGRLWSVSRIPRACEPSVGAGGAVWLACERVLLYSGDAGRTWARLHTPLPISSLAATGHDGAWIVSGDGTVGRLWRTSDHGKTWKQAWPRLPTRGEP